MALVVAYSSLASLSSVHPGLSRERERSNQLGCVAPIEFLFVCARFVEDLNGRLFVTFLSRALNLYLQL